MTTLDLSTLTLRACSHDTRADGVCAMEAVAWLAGERHSDRPKCACPIIGSFVRAFNDRLPDDGTRTRLLLPLVPRLVGSRSTYAIEQRRAFLAVDWVVRAAAPRALSATGNADLVEFAARLRALPELVDVAGTEATYALASAARKATTAYHTVGRDVFFNAEAVSDIADAVIDNAVYACGVIGGSSNTAAAAAGSAGDAAYPGLWDEAVALIERMLDIREDAPSTP